MVDVVGIAQLLAHADVVRRRDADEDAGRRVDEAVRRVAGALERLPCELEGDPLLRIHPDGLARGDAEDRGIEAVDLVEERSADDVRRPGMIRVGVVHRGGVPALRRERADGVDAVLEHAPERLGRLGAAGHPQRHPDDRERLGAAAARAVELVTQPLDRVRGLSQAAGDGWAVD